MLTLKDGIKWGILVVLVLAVAIVKIPVHAALVTLIFEPIASIGAWALPLGLVVFMYQFYIPQEYNILVSETCTEVPEEVLPGTTGCQAAGEQRSTAEQESKEKVHPISCKDPESQAHEAKPQLNEESLPAVKPQAKELAAIAESSLNSAIGSRKRTHGHNVCFGCWHTLSGSEVSCPGCGESL